MKQKYISHHPQPGEQIHDSQIHFNQNTFRYNLIAKKKTQKANRLGAQ